MNDLMVRKHLRNSLTIDLVLIVIIESVSQLYTISDRYFVNSVQEGGIASINYAQTLFVLPILTISLALSTALFPSLSKNYSSGLLEDLNRQFMNSIRINILIFVPIMFIFFFNGYDIIKIIYQRGKFDASDTVMTAESLKYFSFSIIFYSIYSVLNKMMYSIRIIRALLFITLSGIALKIIFNFVLVNNLAQNGLALSSSLSYIYFFLLSFIIIARKITFKYKNLIVKELILHMLNAVVSYALVVLIWSLMDTQLKNFQLLVPILFCFVYIANQWLIKTESISIFINLSKNTRMAKFAHSE